MSKTTPMLAIVNRAAGGGRCGKRVEVTLERLRAAGARVEVAETERPGHGGEIVREAFAAGRREFLAVGGDGTAHEVVNGLFPGGEGATVGFLPLGTGNSFLRDFSGEGSGTETGTEFAFDAIVSGKRRRCDVMRLVHRGGEIYSINLVSVGFAADVATATNRRYKPLGAAGYALGVLQCLVAQKRRAFPLRVDGGPLESERCLFLAFSNSKFTGGTMKIAPEADTADGLIDFVRFGPIGRIGLLRRFPRIYRGTHITPPWGSRRAVRRVDFELDGEVDLMIDGEVLTLWPEVLEILPGALEVLV